MSFQTVAPIVTDISPRGLGGRFRAAATFMTLLCITHLSLAQDKLALQDVKYSALPGEQLQVIFQLSGPAPVPSSFTIDNPPRLAIDLPDTTVALKDSSVAVDVGAVRTIRAVEAANRTRLVVGLTQVVPYEIRTEDNLVYLTLQPAQRPAVAAAPVPGARPAAVPSGRRIENVDFHRGTEGQALISIILSDPAIPVDLQQRGQKILIDFIGAEVPQKLERRLDVTDFATPVTNIDTFKTDRGSRMVVSVADSYEHLAYQTDNKFSLDVRPLTPAEVEERKRDEFGYSGEKLSLNFQNIEVRAVLQLLADFTGLNIVASDTVTGTITLRLKNVPWDQALDIILRTRGLGKRQSGNVMLIAPNAEIAAREKAELEARKQLEELAPVRTEFFQVNYAKAADIAALLKAKENSILSPRGNVTLDDRTNTLMILDTPEKLEEIGRIIAQLDIPIRQVLIESRIVIATDDFSRNLGIRTGVTAVAEAGENVVSATGSIRGTDSMANSALDNLNDTGSPFPIELPSLDDRLNVNLPAVGATGQLALAILGSDYLVDLELSALQQEGRGEVISNPRVITSNQTEAVIEQGVEIPYQQATSSGATSVAFKKAVLSLSVTPQITPDDRVIMDLQVNKDSVGQVFASVPTINTRSVSTQVLVDNGDTVVLGGIYEQTRSDEVDKVPLLGDIPLLGVLFRQTRKVDDKAELLIFVTPKILKESLQAQFD